MEIQKVKEKMMSLWKETFGDSSEYISLVFDTYFNPDFIAFYEEDNGIKSSLLGVPYQFVSRDNVPLKGLYLCGLATRKEARRRGIMSSLLKEINEKAEQEGFDFTFLIPSGEGVRRFYRDRGYHDTFYLKKEYYVRGHNFGEGPDITFETYTDDNASALIEFLEAYGNVSVDKKNSYILNHTNKDWETVLRESVISNEKIFIAKIDDTIGATAFCKITDRNIEIKRLIAADIPVENSLLNRLAKTFPDSNITIIRDLGEIVARNASSRLWAPFYAQNNGQKAEYEDVAVIEEPYNESLNAFPFGMMRIFNIKKLLEKTGFDKFKDIEVYSEKELKQIILRKPAGSKSDALEKILDLPELNFSASLLLE